MKELKLLFPVIEFDTLRVVVGTEARYSTHADRAVVLLVDALVFAHPVQNNSTTG